MPFFQSERGRIKQVKDNNKFPVWYIGTCLGCACISLKVLIRFAISYFVWDDIVDVVGFLISFNNGRFEPIAGIVCLVLSCVAFFGEHFMLNLQLLNDYLLDRPWFVGIVRKEEVMFQLFFLLSDTREEDSVIKGGKQQVFKKKHVHNAGVLHHWDPC